VTISLGARRRFLLRPRGGGTSARWLLGPGDLVVMGGRSQHDWEHCVPKMAVAGPRASVTMRHSQSPAIPAPTARSASDLRP
jgi:alkylated DNA repair dioxygenase AlkB